MRSSNRNVELPLAVQELSAALNTLVGEPPFFLHEPDLGIEEKRMVVECIESTFVSSVGQFVDEFEDSISDYTKSRHSLAVVNGTSALHLALLGCDVAVGDEVLLSPVSFVAPANAIKYCGANPHFVDIEAQSLSICPIALDQHLKSIAEIKGSFCLNKVTGSTIKAVIVIHAFGHPADIERLIEVAKKWKLRVIEDAAEGLGSFSKDKHVGTFGDVGALSFNGNKIVTSGGGGAVLTNNMHVYQKLKHISKTAKVDHPWDYDHDTLGFNYRMPNLNAALGLAQIKKIEQFVEKKRLYFSRLRDFFASSDYYSLVGEPNRFVRSNFWLQTLVLKGDLVDQRDELLAGLHELQIYARPVWNGLHTLKPFKFCFKADLSEAEHWLPRIINIPSNPT